MRLRNWILRVAPVVAAMLATFAGPALAQRPGPGDEPGGSGPPPIVEPACVWDCRLSPCGSDAFDDARACAAAACPTETAAYESDCGAGGVVASEPTPSCRAAREALLACATTCWEQLDAANAECRTQQETCLAGCPRVEPGAVDAACASPCLAESRGCIKPARKGVASCHATAGCRRLRAAAHAACRADRASEECRVARDASRACFRGCRLSFVEAATGCFDTTKTCVEACPPAATE